MAGIFVIKGMALGISKFSIAINDDGELASEGPQITVAYDACVAWARIALEHRNTAKAKMGARRAIWQSDEADGNLRARSLEEEFDAAMQAIVASATCIDALYDHLYPRSPIGADTKAAWSRNKTARYIQIAETIRATFAIKPDEAVRRCLHAMFALRDASVHPSNAPREPYRHPELDIFTDWRLTVFRGDVADAFVCNAVGLLWDVTRGTRYRTRDLTKFIERFREGVDDLLPEGKPLPETPSVTFTIPKRIRGTTSGDETQRKSVEGTPDHG